MKPQKKQSTVTKWKLFTVFFVQSGEAYQINVILPFVVFMIRDFGISEEDVGFYTGLLTASFMFCQFISSFLWGWYSDIYGRRNALLIGILCGAVAMVIFGMSSSYVAALIARCIAGIMNGNIGVVKAWIADISDATNRGFSYSIVAIGWGAGSIIASSLGGLLVISHDLGDTDGVHQKSEPLWKFWIFEEYPYLLPCIIGGIFTLNSLFWVILFVKDENSKTFTKNDFDNINKNSREYSMSGAKYKDTSHELKSISYHSTSNLSKSLPSYSFKNDADDEGIRKNTRNYSLLQYEQAAYSIEGTMNDTLTLQKLFKFNTDKKPLLDENMLEHKYEEMEINSFTDLFSKTKMVRTVIVIMCYAMYSMLWNQLAPLFAAQSLDFNTTQIGIMMACGGGSLLLFTFLIQPYFLRNYSYKPLSIITSILCFFIVLGMPSISLLKNKFNEPYDLYLLMFLSCLLHGGKYAVASILFVTTLCFLNNSVPPSQCGRVNGIGQSCSALMRGIGPLTGGAIWTWSMTLNTKYNAYPAYIFTLLFLMCVTFSITMFIDKNMQIPWEDRMGIKWNKIKNNDDIHQ